MAADKVSRLTPTFLFLLRRSESLIMLYFSSRLAGQEMKCFTISQSPSVG